MQLNDYQRLALSTETYPRENGLNIIYPALGLAGEAGEVVEKVKKAVRSRRSFEDKELRLSLIRELGDVMWYVAALSRELGTTLREVAEENLEKLADRKERGVLKGEGDNR